MQELVRGRESARRRAADLAERVDVDFLTAPKPTGTFREPSAALVAEKVAFGAARKARWFGV